MINLSPISSSLPFDLRKELPNAWIPWNVGPRVFQEMQTITNQRYKKVQVLPTDPDWRFVWRYFHHDKPAKYGIQNIYCIHERHQEINFESNLSSIEREAMTFKPSWDQEPRADQRAHAIERWKQATEIFSPFHTQEADGRTRTWNQTKVLPLWHGSSLEKCDSVCTSGFVYFGKEMLDADNPNGPKCTDDGFFGSGIYFTNSARYAADIYSKGHILLAWVSMREPFPFVGDQTQSDMAALRGKGAYKTYNAHYVPVVPTSPDPFCPIYHPCQKGQKPSCDEIVVFHKSQTLPRFWVELHIELPYLMTPSNIPLFVNELTPHLFKILQNSEVDRDQKLRNVLNRELEVLLKLEKDDDLKELQQTLFFHLTQLIESSGKVNRATREIIIAASIPQISTKPFPIKSTKVPLTNLTHSLVPPSITLQVPQIDLIAQEILSHVKRATREVLILEGKDIQLSNGKRLTQQEISLKAVDLDPLSAHAYNNLGNTLQDGESIRLINGRSMSKKILYLQAIDLNSKFAHAYNNLGHTLQDDGYIKLLNGTLMTEQSLYLKAIDLDPNFAIAYKNLGNILPENGSIKLLNGKSMTKQRLYLKAIDLNPNCADAYCNLANILPPGCSIRLLNGTLMTEQSLYIKWIDLDPNCTIVYNKLADTLPLGCSLKLLNGRNMTKEGCYLKVIDLNPNNDSAYNNLGLALPGGRSVRLLNGTSMTKEGSYLKAIDLNPNNDSAYNNLGLALPDDSFINLLNKTAMTKQSCYLKAIDLNPNNDSAYNNLGFALSDGGSINLLNGTSMTKQTCYLKAIDLNPNNDSAYNNLGGNILPPIRGIMLLNRTSMAKKSCYLKAIDLNPNNDSAYNNLGLALSDGGSINLLNGTSMTKQSCYLKAIDLNPNFACGYDNLGFGLTRRGSVQLLNGTVMTKQSLHLKAIDLNPNFASAYKNLGLALFINDSVQLLNGTSMTTQSLYLKAIDLDPDFGRAYYCLAQTITKTNGSSIKLLNGKSITREQLLLCASSQQNIDQYAKSLP